MNVRQSHSIRSRQSTRSESTNKAFEEKPTQIRSGIEAREFKWKATRFVCRDFIMEALRATISIAANHMQTFPKMHIDMSRAYFREEAQRLELALCHWRREGSLTPRNLDC